MGDRILVTGAGGYVGRHVCDRLAASGYTVRGLVRRLTGPLPFEVFQGDLTDREALRRMLEGVDTVVHCAARVGSGTPRDFERDNVEATDRLVSAAGRRRFVHVSTIRVYGDQTLRDADEDTKFEPGADPYGATKVQAEDVVKASAASWLIVRPAVVWGGPHDRRLMSGLRRLAQTRAVVFPGACETPMPFTHVDNLTDLIAAAIARPEVAGECLNAADGSLADGVSVSFREFVLSLGRSLGLPFRVVTSLPLPLVTWAVRTGADLARRLSAPWPTGLRPEVLRLFNTACTVSVARSRALLGVSPLPREHLASHASSAAPGGARR